MRSLDGGMRNAAAAEAERQSQKQGGVRNTAISAKAHIPLACLYVLTRRIRASYAYSRLRRDSEQYRRFPASHFRRDAPPPHTTYSNQNTSNRASAGRIRAPLVSQMAYILAGDGLQQAKWPNGRAHHYAYVKHVKPLHP
jgi:hypothetical protein